MAAHGGIQRERAAAALAYAAFHTDEEAASHFEVATRTIENWRKRLSEDEELAGLFAYKKAHFSRAWEAQLDRTITAGLIAAETCFASVDPKNPECLKAIAEMMQTIADFKLAQSMINARVDETVRGATAASGQVAASSQGRSALA